MKKSILLLCTAGLLTANLCMPAAGVSLANVRSNLAATPAVQGQTSSAPDAKGTVSFENLRSRMRTDNFGIRSLQATLDSQLAFNREQAYKDLQDAINAMADGAWYLASNGEDISSLQASIESMHEQMKALKEEDYNKGIQKLSFQMEQSIRQMIMGSEALYLNIFSTESTLSDLNRSLKTMELSMKEMELRYELGQVSALTLEQFKANYSNVKSQAAAAELAIQKMKASLHVLLGGSPTEALTLSALPSVSQTQTKLLRIEYDSALQIAKERSPSLSLAKMVLEDAEETWDDAKSDYWTNSSQYKMAEQTYKAAVYTYESAVKDFELSFRSLYESLPDAQQALDTAKGSLSYQEQNYAAAQLKHRQGQLSAAALQSAEDALWAAKSSVSSADINVFSLVNNYEWAVERGMLS